MSTEKCHQYNNYLLYTSRSGESISLRCCKIIDSGTHALTDNVLMPHDRVKDCYEDAVGVVLIDIDHQRRTLTMAGYLDGNEQCKTL